MRLRVIPLTPDGVRTAALVLCRDVTEVRRRERELVGKDATIREIHHRVKNNLQTVAALLRLQARRLPARETGAREALAEAERRVGSIAVVHETLSQARSDERSTSTRSPTGSLALTGEMSAARRDRCAVRRGRDLRPAGRRRWRRRWRWCSSSWCRTPSSTGCAAAAATVLVAVPAGRARRAGGAVLVVAVTDDGAGLPAGFDPAAGGRLGLQIVRTLVEGGAAAGP